MRPSVHLPSKEPGFMKRAVTLAPRSVSRPPGVRAWWVGIALSGALAAAGIAAASLSWARNLGLSALTLAIVFGIIAGNTFFPAIAPFSAAGVDFSRNTLLRAGVILYGFRITFSQLADVGWGGVAIDVLMVALTYTIAVQFGTRVLKLDRETSMLIGTGSAICGAAAVLAAEPVLRAQPHRVSVAVATVVVFGTLGMFIYPLFYPYLGLSQQTYGVFTGSTIHEVAQVVAAGRAVSDTAAAAAVIEQVEPGMVLAPVLFLLSRTHGHGGARHGASVRVPWFAFLFIVACAVNSVDVLPDEAVKDLVDVDTLLLAMAMA